MMRRKDKRGISTIVATVLVVLITVAAVTILWAGIVPLIDVDLKSYDSQLTIETSGGYTFYDENDDSVTLQVEASGKDSPDAVQIILTLQDGTEIISAYDSPILNNRVRYYLNVLAYAANPPVSVSVAPLFTVEGKKVLGQKSKTLKLPTREEDAVFYGTRSKTPADTDETTGSIAAEYVTSSAPCVPDAYGYGC